MLLPRSEMYNPNIKVGHYTGRFRKDAPTSAQTAVCNANSVRKNEKYMHVSVREYIKDISQELAPEDPLAIIDAQSLLNPTIELSDNYVRVISEDGNKIITINTNNPNKVLEQIVADCPVD